MNAISKALQKARRVVFFGGAGVSVPSGIPDFRGENGLYAREYDGLTAEMLLSH
ncbi:MAG: NAD-dependent protein deacylase, partial [Clostridiales bacterium]|nr:NAD-dependent protein deacylase [Clostridiales bacterium]